MTALQEARERLASLEQQLKATQDTRAELERQIASLFDPQPIFDAIWEHGDTKVASVDEVVTWVKSIVAELGQAENAASAVDEDREATQTERDEAFDQLRLLGWRDTSAVSGTLLNDGLAILDAVKRQQAA